jgi:hypothetical protein
MITIVESEIERFTIFASRVDSRDDGTVLMLVFLCETKSETADAREGEYDAAAFRS